MDPKNGSNFSVHFWVGVSHKMHAQPGWQSQDMVYIGDIVGQDRAVLSNNLKKADVGTRSWPWASLSLSSPTTLFGG